MHTVDFAQIKASVTLAQVCSMLGLVLRPHKEQLRGACPRCRRGGDRVLVITPGKGWTCFANKKEGGRYPGGDVIGLVAHIKALGIKEAAEEIAARFPIAASSQAPDASRVVGLHPTLSAFFT